MEKKWENKPSEQQRCAHVMRNKLDDSNVERGEKGRGLRASTLSLFMEVECNSEIMGGAVGASNQGFSYDLAPTGMLLCTPLLDDDDYTRNRTSLHSFRLWNVIHFLTGRERLEYNVINVCNPWQTSWPS